MDVTDDAEVSDLEERLVLILVNHDDGAGGLHAGGVLDSTGDAKRDVQIRRNRDAGLAHLVCRVVEALIDCIAGGTDGAAEGVGKRLLMVEKLSSTPRPPETTTFAAVSSGRADFS